MARSDHAPARCGNSLHFPEAASYMHLLQSGKQLT
jgi:hypothetical protein